MVELLSVQDLPVGFRYPASFIRVVELGLTNLEPWHMLEGSRLRERNQGLAQRFPARSLVPFAIRQDNDDVACWDLELSHAEVVVIHDFSSPGSETREEYTDFFAWFRRAIEDLIEFE